MLSSLDFKHCHQKDSPWSVQQCVLSQHFAPPWEPWIHLLVTCCSPLRLLFIWGGLGEVTPRHLLHYSNPLLALFLCDKFLSIQRDPREPSSFWYWLTGCTLLSGSSLWHCPKHVGLILSGLSGYLGTCHYLWVGTVQIRKTCALKIKMWQDKVHALYETHQ